MDNKDTLPTIDDIINSFTSFTDFRSKNKDTKKSDVDAKKKDTKKSNESCKEDNNVFRYRNLIEDGIFGSNSYYDDKYGEYYGPEPDPDDEVWLVVVTEGIVDYVEDWVFDKKASEETLPFNVNKYLEEHKDELKPEYNDCLAIDKYSIDTIENTLSSIVDVDEWSYEIANKTYDEVAKLNPKAKLYLMGFTNYNDGIWKPID